MKNPIVVLSLLASMLFAISCDENNNEDDEMGDDGDNKETYLAKFVGTWETDKILSDCEGVGNRTCGTDDVECPGYLLTISEQGAYTLENDFDGINAGGNVDVIDTDISLCKDGAGSCDSYKYTFTDNGAVTLTFYDGAGKCRYTYKLSKK